jgi:hypothetical protein
MKPETPIMSKTLRNIGNTANFSAGTPKYKNIFEIIFVMLNEWFKSTVSEPVKLVVKKPFSKFGYAKNIIIFNASGIITPINLTKLVVKLIVIFFFS